MELNRDTLRKIRGLILFTVIVLAAALNYQVVLKAAAGLAGMLTPFLLGGAIAFVLNVPMRKIESLMPKRAGTWKRPVSLVLSLILVLGILGIVFFVVTPELLATMKTLQSSLPVFVSGVIRQLETWFAQYPEIVDILNTVQIDWESTFRSLADFVSAGAASVWLTTVYAARQIVNVVTVLGIGLVFAIYILLQKENLSRQLKKLFYAFLPKKTVEEILRIAAMTERIFSSFLAGQCLEALILGTMFFVTLTLFRMPYAILMGVLIAFTALIPIFGAFIGCAIGTFLMLMVSPLTALIFIGVFLVLQQLEGNLIYPHVVGGSVGLPSIWVLVAVTLGGSLMGIVGMLIFIPTCSVLYSLLRETVNRRLAGKEKREKQKA